MGANWTYLKDGRPLGPFTTDQMRQLASAGVLLPTDMVKSDTDGVWVSAGTVPELTGPPKPPARPSPPPLPPSAVSTAPASHEPRKPGAAAGRSWLALLVVWSAAAPLVLVVLHYMLLGSGVRLPAGVLWAGGVLALLTWLYLGARAVLTGVLPTFAGRLRRRPLIHRVGGLAVVFAGWWLFVELTREAQRPVAEAVAATTDPPAGYERVGAHGGEEVLYRPGHRPEAERLAAALRDVGEFNGRSPKTFAVERRDGGWVVRVVATDAARQNPAVHAFYRHSLGVRVAARAFPGEPVEFQFCDPDLNPHVGVALPAAGVVEVQGRDAVYYLGPVRAEAERVAAFLKPRLGAPGERAFVLARPAAEWTFAVLNADADALSPAAEKLFAKEADELARAVLGTATQVVVYDRAFAPKRTFRGVPLIGPPPSFEETRDWLQQNRDKGSINWDDYRESYQNPWKKSP